MLIIRAHALQSPEDSPGTLANYSYHLSIDLMYDKTKPMPLYCVNSLACSRYRYYIYMSIPGEIVLNSHALNYSSTQCT